MKKYTLNGTLRENTGRKVKNLRLKGTLPANVYGKGFASISIEVDASAFKDVFAHAGETSVVELVIGGVVHPVLIHAVQIDPVSSAILHIELYQVDLSQKVKTKVPIILVGDSPIVTSKMAVLLTLLSEVEVEALPKDLPDKIEVDVSSLSELDQEIVVSELRVSDGVKMLTDASVGIVKTTAIVSKEAKEQEAQEEAASAAKETAEAGAAAEEKVAESTEVEKNAAPTS